VRPLLVDLFCGAGGASVGYHRAGFDVVGVDIRPQPNYPFEFVQGDALSAFVWWSGDIDAIHASPPCQHYAGSTAWRGDRGNHPDLIAPTRDLLVQIDLPYVIENVPDARRHLINPTMLSGDDVGLPIHRRRFFETNWPLNVFEMALRHEHRAQFDHGATTSESDYRDLMGCDWMTVVESRQAIPPAYTELIGHQLMAHVRLADSNPSSRRQG
jgi:hypothetical protein